MFSASSSVASQSGLDYWYDSLEEAEENGLVLDTTKSLTQRVTEAGFTIKTDSGMDHIGPLNIVTNSRDGKRTRRKARKYEEALEACARARGLIA